MSDPIKIILGGLIDLFTRKLPIPVLFIYLLPTVLRFSPNVVEYYIKLVVGGVALIAMTLLSGFLSVFLRLFGKAGYSLYYSGKLFEILIRSITGVTVVKTGRIEELRRGEGDGAVFIANHLTQFDIYILACEFPTNCIPIVKSNLQSVPVIGWALVLHDAIFIDRKRHGKTIKAFRAAGEKMRREGTSAYLFPEGKRSHMNAPGIQEFKKGAFHLAIQAQVPIVPVIIQNYSNLVDKDRKIFKRGRIELRVLDPIPTSGMTEDDVDRMTDRTRRRMSTAIKAMGMASPI